MFVDVHRDIHARHEVDVRRRVKPNLDRDDLRHLLEVATGVALREQGEDGGCSALDFRHAPGDVGVRVGVDVDVDHLTGVDRLDVGFIDTRCDVGPVQVVGDGKLSTGGDVGADYPVVHGYGAIAWRLDRHLRFGKAALNLDAAHDLVLAHVRALGGGPIEQRAGGRGIDRDLVPIDLGVVSADVVAGVEEID